MNHDHLADSAGVPWEGRSFQNNEWAGDNGETPASIAALIASPALNLPAFIAALAGTRLLVPLLASLGEGEVGPTGHMVDKSADLALVAVKTPDGKSAIPAFTSVAEMTAWHPDSRPVPVLAPKVALACASEGHERLVINPASQAFVLRRPAIAALAQGLPWAHPHQSPEVLEIARSAAKEIPEIYSVDLFDGDPANQLQTAELQIQLGLVAGIEPTRLREILDTFSSRLQTATFRQLVDSISLKLVVA